MKINFTKKEYRLLLEMLYLSDWMMNSHSVESAYKEHEQLRKKILSHHKEMGVDDVVEYSEADEEYYVFNEFDGYMHEKFIAAYDTEVFWRGLSDRLATRDAVTEVGPEKFRSMDDTERFMKLGELADKYDAEFESHGLERVIIDHAN